MEKLNNEQFRVQALVNSLTNQRNVALNALAQAEAEIAILQERLKAADGEKNDGNQTDHHSV